MIYIASWFPFVMLSLILMIVQRKSTTYSFIIRNYKNLKTFEHEKLLLLKSLQNTKNYQYCYHWGKKVICLTGVFSGKVIDFINEPSIWRSFLKNVFADDGNILVTNRFDRNIYCTLSRGLRIVLYLQEIEVYSLIQHLFVLQWLLNSKEFQFITKNM